MLVVGGGQAGLSIAARLTQLGIDTLIVDREQRRITSYNVCYTKLLR